MARRILFIAVAVIVAGFLYLGYTSYDAGRATANGTVYSNDPPSSSRRSGDIPAASTDTRDAKNAGQVIVYPIPASTQPAPAAAVSTDQTTQPGVAGTGAAAAPATDTISPNPPNGMAFAGKGKYQLYRQGDITWRLDTDTGQSCVLFATDEQWKLQRVLRAACSKR